jgi:zinc protease
MKIRLSILTFIIWTISFGELTAQPFDYSQKIPMDSSIRYGKLPNGITYYIKRNLKPEKRVELRLAVNAGSILEDSDQLGLAHFTEHMAFNGTKHFAKNELVSYLQSVGVRFGADLNAYTGFDETVYMLQIPTDKEDLIEKGIDVLEDWAHELSFDTSEIDKERGVVIEEWRLGRGAEQRMEDKYFPVIFHNSRYAKRLPIGNKESLEKFQYNVLKRFYSDWYRPDLMAVLAIGDIDVNEYEKKIKEHFSNIPIKQNRRPRKEYEVPNHKETFVCVTSDKEAPITTVGIYYKTDEKPQVTIGEFREYARRQLYFEMFNQRIAELTQLPNPPFINAFSYFGNIGARNKEAYVSEAIVSDTGINTGLKALLEENEKAKQFGFAQSELDRAKMNLLNGFEKYYNERDKTESDNYASEYIRNFLNKEPIPGITFEFNFMKQYLPEVTLGDINKLAKEWIIDTNRVAVVTAPQKEGLVLPSEKAILAVIDNSAKQQLKAYNDKLANTELMAQKPKAGKILSEKNIPEIGVTIFTLSNGCKVLLKPTDFKNDEIQFSGVSPGGQFLYADSDHFSAHFAISVVTESGVSDFSNIELQKLLAGKTVSAEPNIGNGTEGIKASCAPKDLETMFQLVYLYFTKPRVDSNAFISFKNKIKAYLNNIESNPQMYYSDQVAKILSQNNPRGGGIPKETDIEKINLKRVYEIYRDRFADASDFNFVMVGNFKTDSVRHFLETYIASLPSINRKETWKDLGIRPPKGNVYKNINKGSDPKSFVSLYFTDTANYNTDDAYWLRSLEDLLDIRLIEMLREEKSGVYSVGAKATMSRVPYNNYSISIKFPCAPNNIDSLVKEAFDIISEIKETGVSEKNMGKIKETQERELEVSLKKNGYWLSYLENSYLYNDDLLNILKKKERIEKLTSKNIQEVARKYFKDQYIKIVLYPEAVSK